MNSRLETHANEAEGDAQRANVLTAKVILLLAALAAISNLSTNIILPAFPEMARQLNVSSQELGLTLSSFFITFAFAQLLVGPLADRYGRKRLVVGGLMIFVVGTFWAANAATLDMLILGRVIQAIGVCAAAVLARAIARDLYEGENLARALSLTMIAAATAPGFSPLIGSMLNTTLGWRALFIAVGMSAILIALFYLRGIGETLPAHRRVTQSVPAILIAYGKLASNRLFILPALATSLLMSGLFASFAAAPSILMEGMGLSSLRWACISRQLSSWSLPLAWLLLAWLTVGVAAPSPCQASRLRVRQVHCCWSAQAIQAWAGTHCRWCFSYGVWVLPIRWERP